MKKKTLALLVVLSFNSHLFSQVGINTNNPQGVFNVDGKKDNNKEGAPSKEQQLNDFVITREGNVGIGTTAPIRKLEVVSTSSPAFKLNDGSQGEGYVLTSDAYGNGSWKAFQKPVLANWSSTGISTAVNQIMYTGTSITLPPGRWLIFTNVILAAHPNPNEGQGVWVRLSWSSTQPNYTYSGGTGNLNSGTLISSFGLASGTTLINNTSSSEKTYYLFNNIPTVTGDYEGVWQNLGSSSWAENSIIAYPAN
ncbi:hypothetical protein [Empedobacter brevis]|uniref:hypothetical protein n=1 Tax=Empedobacter brevis TaxID=247 RepID=UPI0039AF227E